MIKLTRRLVLAGLIVGSLMMVISANAEEEFSCQITDKTVVFKSGGKTFSVDRNQKYRWFNVGGYHPSFTGYWTLGKESPGVGINPLGASILLIVDEPEEKVVCMVCAPKYAWDKDLAGKPARELRVEVNFQIKKGFPALFVWLRKVNMSKRVGLSGFRCSSYGSVSKYAVENLELKNAPERSQWIGKGRWAFFSGAEKEGGEIRQSKMGVILKKTSRIHLGRSFQPAFWYEKKQLKPGEYQEVRIIYTVPDNPGEVKDLFEKTRDYDWGEFITIPSIG